MIGRLNKNFRIIVFKEEADSNSLKNYYVLLASKNRDDCLREIWIRAVDLLYMIPGKEIRSVYGDVKIFTPSIEENLQALDFVTIEDLSNEVQIEYCGFHKVRQIVRARLSEKGKKIRKQLEQINKEIALAELQSYKSYYDSVQGDERKFFSVYFRERFPEKSKSRFDRNIGEMFGYYSRYFHLSGLPLVSVYKTSTIFRTGYRDSFKTNSYTYPIKVGYFVEEPSYMAKAVVCTIKEMGIPFPIIE